jgi:hypothetical protein
MVNRTALFLCAMIVLVAGGGPALAQADSGWRLDLAPLYFWAATTDGNLAIRGRTVPVYLDFSDAKDKLAGAVAFHGEVRKGRWGALGDINFIRLSSDVNYTVPIADVPIAGTMKLDQMIFNGAVLFAPRFGTPLDLVGGIRTYELSPRANFTGPLGAQLAAIDVSHTTASLFGGAIYRPKLSNRLVLLTQGDVGGGSAFTWSAFGGLEFQIKRWVGVMAGYKVLRVDMGTVPTSGNALVDDLRYEVTQHGPVFSLMFHWSER